MHQAVGTRERQPWLGQSQAGTADPQAARRAGSSVRGTGQTGPGLPAGEEERRSGCGGHRTETEGSGGSKSLGPGRIQGFSLVAERVEGEERCW